MLYIGYKGTPTQRFWSKVDTSGECWIWLGAKDQLGYGRFNAGNHQTILAHRFALQEVTGQEIDNALDIDHLCRNPSCVNPLHLQVVTHQENCRRGRAGITTRNRMLAIQCCPRGHAYDLQNTYIYKGERYCRKCRIINHQAWRKRRKLCN